MPKKDATSSSEAPNGGQPLEDLATTEKKNLPIGGDLKDIKTKSQYFDQDFPDDIFCTQQQSKQLQEVLTKLRLVQKRVGNGHFNLLGVDDFFRSCESIRSPVTDSQKKFLEEIFFADAKKYGFFGDKNFTKFTDEVRKDSVVKVPFTGHYLKKGKSLETYQRIRRDIGSSVVLTSGVRGMVKQFHLFLEKTAVSKGNLSKASRSIAPPGYSFHGHQDFDIGKVGFGYKNFTDDFSNTTEFKKLIDLGYVDIRYEQMNALGVRFEPWHIKIS